MIPKLCYILYNKSFIRQLWVSTTKYHGCGSDSERFMQWIILWSKVSWLSYLNFGISCIIKRPFIRQLWVLLKMMVVAPNDNDNDNDNDNILFDHNVQIEITIFNTLENQIINWSGDYY